MLKGFYSKTRVHTSSKMVHTSFGLCSNLVAKCYIPAAYLNSVKKEKKTQWHSLVRCSPHIFRIPCGQRRNIHKRTQQKAKRRIYLCAYGFILHETHEINFEVGSYTKFDT